MNLLPHQIEARDFLLTKKRAILADQPRVGKTLPTAAAALQHLPAIIVCPAIAKTVWEAAFQRLGCDDVRVINGRKDAASVGWHKVIIVNYDLLPNLILGKAQTLVLDECHRIKGGKRVKRSQAAVALAASVPESGVRVVMSGTPLINHPLELLPSLRVIDRLRDFARPDLRQDGFNYYLGRFAPRIDSYGTRGVANLDELHKTLKERMMIRRKRIEVLTLPNKGRMTHIVEITEEGAEAYRRAQRDLFAFIEEAKGRPAAERALRAEALVLLNVLRDIAGNGKVPAVAEYAEALLDEGEQVFITASHQSVVNRLASRLSARATVVKIVGGMTDAAKMRAVDAFQSGEARVLIGNIVAAGVGLTLTSARHHISAELPWTSADLMQCEDRLSRIGQTREVVSHVLIMAPLDGAPSIDERMFGLIDAKLGTLSEVLDGARARLLDDDAQSVALGVLKTYGWTVAEG